jgi:hypothetical protein
MPPFGTPCAGATSPATPPPRQICPKAWPRRCTSGARSSSAPSSTAPTRTGSTPPGCCSPPPACGAVRSPASAGPTSTWTPAASRRADPGWSSTTKSTSRSPRRPRVGARWPLTQPRWRPCASTAPARPRSASPWGRGGTTPAWYSPGRTAGPSTRSGSRRGSSSSPGRPPEDQAARRAAQLRHGRPRRRHPGEGRLRAARARHHRHHDGHLQPCASRPRRRGRRHGRQAHPGRPRPRAGASR